ncbi:unnamed protein product [Arabis nemorensis]|uniref:Small RNA 2'-O-methyltransferase n=1 Tax=Arabis nemorensis TaxID=586526 RepID=A0A565CF41_9BRAS|nr:unnamed protein product [Arabis nemorensis]
MTGREKQTLTPKAIIHQKFGVKASYRIEEVHVSSQNDCRGLAKPRKGPCLYRCHLQLPDFSVVSNVFKKKKDSEQSAAELALEKLGIQPRDDDDDITVDEAWDAIVRRIKYIFSDEFLSAEHPLGGHLRAALQRDGDCCSSVPVSVIATFDSKINSLCKVISPSVDSIPFLVMSYVMKAAAKLSDYIVVSPHGASLRRKNPYPPAIIDALAIHVESIKVEAVHIQCNRGCEEPVEPVTLDISSGRYYLDIIAEKLGPLAKLPRAISVDYIMPFLNIHGDAILASVGYPLKSHDLEHDDYVSQWNLQNLPKALIAVQLPLLFTTKSNWRGPFPREILCMFCRQQQLAEPVFTISTVPVESMSDILRSHKKLTVSEHDDTDYQYLSRAKEEIPGSGKGYRCDVKILSTQNLVLDCSLRKFYEKENYAIQNASLKALSWFTMFFGDLDVDSFGPCYTDDDLDIQFKQRNCYKETFPSSRVFELPDIIRNGDLCNSRSTSMPWEKKRVQSIANGSLVSVCYSVSLKVDAEYSRNGETLKELIESSEEIEFEVGHGSMNQHLESVVTQMSVGQYVCFSTALPAEGLVLAAATDTVRTCSLLSELGLEYSVLLLGVKEPTEERMEAACFKPPLSKQRVEYALKQIKESSASTMVDFGCGSGSLLDSLLDCPTSLQTIIGVDISQKGLARAAKMLHSKLNKGACNLRSIILYDGSILEFDSRLHDIDIGTCLEGSAPNHPEDKSKSHMPKFRNHDHKFEWTREQFNKWASKLAKLHNYSVEFTGVGGYRQYGKADPGFASQIALCRRQSLSEVNIVEKFKEGLTQPYKVIWEWRRGKGDK